MRTLLVTLIALTVLTFSSIVSAEGTLPISTMRDYNGTYTGTPGTGSVGYSVLYRDNEDGGTTSGCNGEGCGMHPGVDISVSSGANVYASFGGTVVRSECDETYNTKTQKWEGWGGIIVIRSNHPYDSGYIYTTYAHLKDWDYSVNDSIDEGDIIGESGGGSSDYCHGGSTGAHLHFQIDNDDDATYPWWPSNVHEADDDFDVTDHTYNPIPFVTESYFWSFGSSGFSEYWQPRNEDYWGVSSGYLWIDGGSDPGIHRSGTFDCGETYDCSGEIAAEADLYQYVLVTLYNYCVDNPAKIYFTTSEDDSCSENQMVSFNYTGPDYYWVYMGGNAYWEGIVNSIRIDPAEDCNPYSSDASIFYSIGIFM